MDAKTVEGLGGKITKLVISYDRKVWRDKRGSVGGSLGAEVSVGADADADAVANALYDWLKETSKRNIGAVMLEVVSEPTVPRPLATVVPPEDAEPGVPFGPPATETSIDIETTKIVEFTLDIETTKIIEFTLARRTDGKTQLDLYPEIAGKVGQYPEIKFVASDTVIWEMLEPVAGGIAFKTPMRLAVNWIARWKKGRPTGKAHKDGTPGFYKDLMSLRLG